MGAQSRQGITMWQAGRFPTARLVLSGVAVSSLCSSMTNLLIFRAPSACFIRTAVWSRSTRAGTSQDEKTLWLPPLGGRLMPALIFRLKPEATRETASECDVLPSPPALGAHEGIKGKPVQIRRGPATVSEGVPLQ
jgi:hypothetical protein